MNKKILLNLTLMFSVVAFAERPGLNPTRPTPHPAPHPILYPTTACKSQALTAKDLNGWQPAGGSFSVASANEGTVKQIPVTDGASWCQANVVCNYWGQWELRNIDCSQNPYLCESKTFTVYDLGGWTPVGGSFTTGNGKHGKTRNFCASASNGKTCRIVLRCQAGAWNPDWTASACPNHCR